MSENGQHVKIVTPKCAPIGTRVFVDDMEIVNVVNVEFKHHIDMPPIVRIEFYPESVEIEAEALVVMVERVK